jgi:flagellar protein FlbD
VILLTRLGGPVFALNPDLVERADCTPDTVITLVDGKKYLVAESLPEVISLIRQFRATVVADAQQMTQQQPPAGTIRSPRAVTDGEHPSRHPDGDRADNDAEPTNVVQLHRRER